MASTPAAGAGAVVQTHSFLAWDGGVIPSTDPAGIAYVPLSGHLIISDSEIDEEEEWQNENIFEVARSGAPLHSSYVTQPVGGASYEPAGIAFNPVDGRIYVVNDNQGMLYQYILIGGQFVLTGNWDLTGSPYFLHDPEGITANTFSGRLFIADGASGGRKVSTISIEGPELTLHSSFDVSDRILDPEGIAFDPETRHVFIVSTPDLTVFEYTPTGLFVDEYDISGLDPAPITPQGLTFGPASFGAGAWSLYISDGGIDNNMGPNYQDGWVYEVLLVDPAAADDPLPADAESSLRLAPSFPNPSADGFVIPFALSRELPLTLRVFGPRGELVRTLFTGSLPSGSHEIRWDAGDAPAGTYFCELRSGPHRARRKLLVLK
jgi:hypothetical protein